jgi:hypothetical protein
MKLIDVVAKSGPMQIIKAGFDKVWDWAISQLFVLYNFMYDLLRLPSIVLNIYPYIFTFNPY